MSFCLGDASEIVQTPTGYPFIQIFYNSTKSYSATNVMVTILIVTLTSSTISEVATGSRQLWSFARDKGVPFHGMLSHVSLDTSAPFTPAQLTPLSHIQITPGWNIPINAVLISLLVTVLLSLINIGSTVALNAVVSLTVVSLIGSYMITISCVLLRRFHGPPLPPHRWSLGRYGAAINIAALCFLLPIFIFTFFPVATPVVASTMNWSIVLFGGIIIFATCYYFAFARHVYVPPVALVKREEMYSS